MLLRTVPLVVVAIVAVGCGGPAASAPPSVPGPTSAGVTTAPPSAPAPSTTIRPSASPQTAVCATGYTLTAVSGGTRIDDPINGFAVTLPAGWAQVDRMTGRVVDAFAGLKMNATTTKLMKLISDGTREAGHELLAADLRPELAGGPEIQPFLNLTTRPADGSSRESLFAKRLADLTAQDLPSDIQRDANVSLNGFEGFALRWATVARGTSGTESWTVHTEFALVEGDVVYEMTFLTAEGDAQSETPIVNGIAQSIEVHDETVRACTVAG